MLYIGNMSIIIGTPDMALYKKIKKYLHGYATIAAGDVSSLIKASMNRQPAIILLDERMNELVGSSFLSELLLDIEFLKEVPLALFRRSGGVLNIISSVDSKERRILISKVESYIDSILAIRRKIRLSYEETEHFTASLITALQAKDGYSKSHSARVAAYAGVVAREIGRNWEYAYLAGLMHDVGKIGIPDAVLTKPGRLTPEEMGIMQSHPIKSEKICKPVETFEKILPVIRGHHERIDGKGYPDGLKGSSIPLLSRIIAVVDSFDALTSDRPYRKHMEPAMAMEILHDGIGSQWDPDIVGCVEKLYSEKKLSRSLDTATERHPYFGDLIKGTIFEPVA